MAPTWIPLCRTMQRYCEPYFAAVESWRNYEESTLLVNRVMLAETAYHILEEFSLQKDSYCFDLVYDNDVELLPEIEPTPGRTFVFGGDREAFEAARKFVPEQFFNRIGLFFQQSLLKSMAGHNDTYVQQSNMTTRKSILEAIEKLFRLPESAGKGKFVFCLAHTTATAATQDNLISKYKVYSLHPLSPAGKSFVEYLSQSKTGRKLFLPPAVTAPVTAAPAPPSSYSRRDEEDSDSSSSESESPSKPVQQPAKPSPTKPSKQTPSKAKNSRLLKDSDSEDEEVNDFDEITKKKEEEEERKKLERREQMKRSRRDQRSKSPPTTTPKEKQKKKRQSKGSTTPSSKTTTPKSTSKTATTTPNTSTSETKKRVRKTAVESVRTWITDHFSIGTKVAAFFSLPTDEGGFENQLYFGTVTRYSVPTKPEKKDQLYHIQWEDGDEQDYNEDELQKGILLYNQENQWIYHHESIGIKVAGEFELPSLSYPSLTNVIRRRKSSSSITTKKKLYIGKVTKFLPATGDKENDQLYHIVWEDGDEEDFYENDLIKGKELYLQYLQDKANDFGNIRNKTIFNDGEDDEDEEDNNNNNDDSKDNKDNKEGEEEEGGEGSGRVRGKEKEKERDNNNNNNKYHHNKIKEEVNHAIENEIEKKRKLQEIERRNRRRKRLGGVIDLLLDSDHEEENEVKPEIKRRKREEEGEEEAYEGNRRERKGSNNDKEGGDDDDDEEEEEEEADRRTWIKQHSSVGNDVATYITMATIIASTGKTSTRRSLIYGRVIKYSPETREGKKNQRYLVIWNPNSPDLRTEDKINEVQYQAALALFKATSGSANNNSMTVKDEVRSVAEAMNEAEEEEEMRRQSQAIMMDEDDEVMVTLRRDKQEEKEKEGEGEVKKTPAMEEIPNSFLKMSDDLNDDDITIEIDVKRSSQQTNETVIAPSSHIPPSNDTTSPPAIPSPVPDVSSSMEITNNDEMIVESADFVESKIEEVNELQDADNMSEKMMSEDVVDARDSIADQIRDNIDPKEVSEIIDDAKSEENVPLADSNANDNMISEEAGVNMVPSVVVSDEPVVSMEVENNNNETVSSEICQENEEAKIEEK